MADLLERLEAEAGARDASLAPAQRKTRGVVHTPAPIARFVARAVDAQLRALQIADGLSDRELTLLDPATGPGIFLAAALEHAGTTAPKGCIGLDVDGAAIERATRALGPAFASAGWPLSLRNVDALVEVPTIHGPVAILGNPPWTARTASRGATDGLLDDFRRDEDGAMRDRKIGVLSDAYVRFVRWALAVLERSPRGGVVGLVTNASFLDGAVHRGMRTWMTRTLDRIDIVDLAGSALVARRGDRDENVFGVRPSVAITIMGRAPGTRFERRAHVRRVRILGGRDDKLDALRTLALDDPRFEDVALVPPAMRFTRRASGAIPREWPSIEEWMPFHREGIQTNRDELVVGRTREELLAKLDAFLGSRSRALARGHFDPAHAREVLRAAGPLDRFVSEIAYRPFDDRFAMTHPVLCHRPRPPIAAAMAHARLALVTSRRDRGDRPFRHLGVVFAPADNCYLSARSSCRARVFPIGAPDGEANFDASILASVEARIGPVTHRAVFDYLVAFLSAETFRSRFDEALRHDPPRVPLPPDRACFDRVSTCGAAIVESFRGRPGEGADATTVVGHWSVRAPSSFADAASAADAAVAETLARLETRAPSGAI
jgi:hypothetical protein